MSLARVKNWIAGEKLYATDLNAEFNSILSNAGSLISPCTASFDLDGNTFIMDQAGATTVVSSTAISWSFSPGSKTGTPGTTGTIANWGTQTYTDNGTAISGTAAAFVAHAIQRPTLAATNASVVTTDAASFYIANSPLASTNETITNAWVMWTDDGAVRHDLTRTVASAAGAVLRGLYLPAVTETVTGSTNITTATGFNLVEVGIPTISAGTALTVTNSATLYVAGAPAAGGAGPATITNAYAIWVDAGNVRFDGNIITGTSCTFAADATTLNIGNASGVNVGLGTWSLPIAQNSQSTAYTTVLADDGRHILHPAADNNPRTFTIDSNANVAYKIGATLTFVNEINTVTIAITSDTLTLAGTGATGSRTLAANGMATAIKITTTKWMISGTGLT